MTKAGDICVQLCERTRGLPKLVLCLFLVILQGTMFNLYMYMWMGPIWLCWFLYDGLNVGLLTVAFVLSSRSVDEQRKGHFSRRTIGWLAWLVLEIGVMVRMLIGFLNFCKLMEENTFFGPSTFKTTIALSSAIFLLLLTSHYEAPYGSPQRLYVVELTGTVLFDLIDVVEAVDVLFVKEAVESLNPTMEVAILVVASINLLLPTIPFVTLSITGFGQRRLSSLLVSAHKALVSVAINLPNLVIRLILWHGFSVGISVFVLKNIVVIVLTTYSFYEHKHDKYHQHKHEEREKSWEKQQLEMTAHHGRATMTPEDKPMEAGHASEGHDEKKAAAESDKHHCRVEAEEKTTPYHGKRRESVA